MMVAVPLLQSSPAFGPGDSRPPALSRCSLTLRLPAWQRSPAGDVTRSQLGLGWKGVGSAWLARRFCPSLMAVMPWALRNCSPQATWVGELSDIGYGLLVGFHCKGD